QSLFLVNQEESKLVANSHVWTGRQVTHTQAAETDIGWFAEADRLPQTLIFDSQGKPGVYVVPGKLATLMIR
ncbi:MAG: hypothetical protein LC775_03265, partial [Acidobacteria bacterium]|nr:hypothetical protein [Acidobacteriota bacterium]